MKKEKLFSIIIFLLIQNIFAQKKITAKVNEAIPQEVIDAINNETEITTVFSIGTNEHFNGQVIRANEIVFSKNALLTLNKLDAPWIVLIADKIKFQNPNHPARIIFGSTNIPIPSKATNGSNGTNGNGRRGRHGKPGAHGQVGTTGTKGFTKKLPHIYIITKELTSPTGNPAFAPLAILGNGLKGGQGGQGGNGGNGGNGVKGQNSSSGVLDCRRGGGNGGNGGNAGKGGKGGDGGNGGDGVSITIASTASSNDAFSYIQLLNSGGIGGPAGSPGFPGTPGQSGGMGRGGGHCGGGRSGSNGSVPNPNNLGYGSEGASGNKGSFILVTAPDLESIFQVN